MGMCWSTLENNLTFLLKLTSKYKKIHTSEHQPPHRQKTFEMCSVFPTEIVRIPNAQISWNMLDFPPLIDACSKNSYCFVSPMEFHQYERRTTKAIIAGPETNVYELCMLVY